MTQTDMHDSLNSSARKPTIDLGDSATLIILPWHDPVVESVGHEIRSAYVETFWLGILGPTATWLLRRIDAGFDTFPDGYELDLADTAAALGLTFQPGRVSPFVRALQRSVMFGAARPCQYGLEVRRFLPLLSSRNLARLPTHLQRAHVDWLPSRNSSTSEKIAV